MRVRKHLILMIWILLPTMLLAQRGKEIDYFELDDSKDQDYGLFNVSLDVGAFFAGKHPANYYNGNPENVNSIYYVLDNPFWYNEIKQALGNRDFELYELPAQMKYKLSTVLGLRFAYNFNSHSSVFFQFHSVRLTATDIFTLKIDSANFTSEPALRQCKIYGSERRTMLELGYRYSDELSVKRLRYIFDIGFNLTDTKVIENKIEVGDFQESLIYSGNYTPGLDRDDEMRQSAIGVGLLLGLGLEYRIHHHFSAEIGATCRLQDINLPGYKKFHPSFSIYVRFNVLNLI